MSYEKSQIVGLVRSAARMAYMAAEQIAEYAEDPTNHLSPADAVEIKNQIRSTRESLKNIAESAAVFDKELAARLV